MTDKVSQIKYLAEEISSRMKVQTTLRYSLKNEKQKAYIEETNSMIYLKKDLLSDVEQFYVDKLNGRVGMYETLNEYLERMENTLETDDDGKVVLEYYKLGISAIDDEFLNGEGVLQSAFVTIGADSGVGKTTMALLMISSLAYQGVKSQFFSFEMGDVQFYNEVGSEAKNKLKAIAKTPYGENLTIDFHSRDINDLATSIQMRADEGVRAFVIDSYLSVHASTDDEFRKMKEVADMLATMKKELGILIVLIAQISKSDSFNNIHDFAGGRALKYESDISIFIYQVNGEEDTTKRHMICAKNRVFEELQGKEIITDYNRVTHKIEKLAYFKDYVGTVIDKEGKVVEHKRLKGDKWGKRG